MHLVYRLASRTRLGNGITIAVLLVIAQIAHARLFKLRHTHGRGGHDTVFVLSPTHVVDEGLIQIDIYVNLQVRTVVEGIASRRINVVGSQHNGVVYARKHLIAHIQGHKVRTVVESVVFDFHVYPFVGLYPDVRDKIREVNGKQG